MAADQAFTQEDFRAWERRAGFDQHGRLAEEAEALGVSEKTIQRLRNGTGEYTRTLALAMSAIDAGLAPWSGRADLSWDTPVTVYAVGHDEGWQEPPRAMPLGHAVATVLSSYPPTAYRTVTIDYPGGVLDREQVLRLWKQLGAGQPPKLTR